MLDSFLEVLAKNETDRQQSVKMSSALMHLPNETLYDLATGKAKLAFGYSDEWLEKYKGSPLFEQAMALEKADLEAEIAREQANSGQPDMSHFWKTQDQIRLQKKMLDLQLIESQEKDGLQVQEGGKLPETITATAQGAGALGDVAAEGAQQGEAGKMAMANFQKAALSLQGVKDFGTKALGAVKDHHLVGKAVDFAKANPAAAGAIAGGALGAAGGALTASRDPQTGEKHWVRGALGGAAGGAVLGAGAGAVGSRYAKLRDAGLERGESLKGAVVDAKDHAMANMRNAYSQVVPMKPAAPAAAPVELPKAASARFTAALASMKLGV